GAVRLGVVDGPDVEAVPEASGGLFEGPGGDDLDFLLIPGAVLDEGFQGAVLLGEIEGEEGLGDGVLLDVQRQAGEPLDETPVARLAEDVAIGFEDGLPVVPQLRSVHDAPPGMWASLRYRHRLPARCVCHPPPHFVDNLPNSAKGAELIET